VLGPICSPCAVRSIPNSPLQALRLLCCLLSHSSQVGALSTEWVECRVPQSDRRCVPMLFALTQLSMDKIPTAQLPACKHLCAHAHAHTHAHTHKRIYASTPMYAHTYMHAHAHTCLHTQAHARTQHACTRKRACMHTMRARSDYAQFRVSADGELQGVGLLLAVGDKQVRAGCCQKGSDEDGCRPAACFRGTSRCKQAAARREVM